MTPDDAQRVAREQMWADNDLILLVTKYDEVKDQLGGLGEARVIELDQVK